MPVLNIPNIGPVSFPDTMPGAEIQQKAQELSRLAEEKFAYKPDYREQGLGALAKAGFGRAAAQLGTTVTDVIPAMVASGLGFKDYAQQKMEDAAKAKEDIESNYPTAFRGYKEIRGVGDVPGYVAETLGELGPDMVAMLTGAGVVGSIGKRVAVGGLEKLIAQRAATTAAERGFAEDAAKVYAERLKERSMAQLAPAARAAGSQAGANVGLYGTSLALNAPDTFQGIYDKTGNLEPGIALAFGAAQALLDSVTPSRILDKFSPAARAKAANELIQQSTIIPPTIKAAVAKEVLKTSAIEGSTEGAQEILGILAERTAGATGEPLSSENIDRFLDASIKGAIGGGVFGIPGGISEARRARAAAMQQAQPQVQPEPIAQPPAPPQVVPPIQQVAVPTAPATPQTPAMEAWSPKLFQETLAQQLAKPEALQNKELIDALRAEMAKRGIPEGEQNVPVPAPAAGVPAAAPVGESVSVPERPAGGEPSAGVAAPQPSGVVRGEEPVGAAPAGAPVSPAPVAPPVAPTPSTGAEPTLEGLKKQWSDAAAAGDSEAMRRINDQIVALKKKLAGEAAPAAAAPVTPPTVAAAAPTPAVAATPVTPKQAKKATPPKPEKVAPNLTGAEKIFESIGREGFQKNKGITVTDTDTQKVADLNAKSKEFTLSKGPGLSAEEAAARAYFSKVPNVQDALDMIAFDLAYESERRRRTPEEMEAGKYETAFMQGMSHKSAQLADKWVRSNLSPKANTELANFRRDYTKERNKSEKYAARRAIEESRTSALDESLKAAEDDLLDDLVKRTEKSSAQRKKRLEEIERVDPYAGHEGEESVSDVAHLIYKVDGASKLSKPVHPVVRHALYHGDAEQALRFLAGHEDPEIARTAKMFLDAGVRPNIQVKHNLRDDRGVPVPGYYDPRTDTIYLDDVGGMNHHVVFHEFGHAALSHVIANPNHPITKQLQTLFNETKDSLDSTYGATDLQEFVAEAMGNLEFKAKLNSINPMGKEITSWQRFSNIVGNFFRRLFGLETKTIESAQDKADKLIAAILSPAPRSRDGELLFAATVHPRGTIAHQALEAVTKGMEKLPFMNQARADKVNQVMRDVFGKKSRELGLSVLPFHAFEEVSDKHLPGFAKMAGRLIKERNGDEAKRNEKITPLVRMVEEWAKKHPTFVDLFNTVIYGSTTAKVDPTRPRSYYEDLTKDDAVLQVNTLAAYDKLKKQLGLIPGGERIYVAMRNAYASMYEEIKQALGARIDSAIQDPKARAQIKNEILKKLSENGGIDPYFPLTRNGDHWLAYSLKDETGQVEYYVRAFESERERARVRAEVEAAGATNVTQFAKMSALSYKNVPPTSFVHNTLKLMELNRPSNDIEAAKYDAAMEQIMRLYLSTLPETSFAKAFNRRENIEGYNRDALRALKEKSFSMSRQLSNMKYASKLNQVRDDAQAYVYRMGKGEGSEDNALAKLYFDALDKRISYAISPTTTNQASRLIASGGFNYLLGFNLSSAVVNALDVPMIVAPYLGGQYGWGSAGKAIHEAGRIFMDSGFGTGFSRKVEVLGTGGEKVSKTAMPSLDNFDFSDPNIHPMLKKYATLARVARDLGMLTRSHVDDALDIDGTNSPLNAVNKLSGAALHYGERMTRQVTLMATYNLELQKLEKEKSKLSQAEREEAAANKAIYTVELLNGGTGAAAVAPIAQSSLGKVLFMFKSFGVARNYLLFRIVREMGKDQPPEVRKAAFRQLAGILGTTALFSGIQGLPLFGVVAMLYNLFKDDDDEDFGSVMHSFSGTTAYKGLLNSLTGLTIAERIGLSNMIFRDDPFSAGSASLADTFASLLGGPVYGVASRIARGMQLMQEGHTERAIESMLPVALANPLKSVRYATEGANTLRGDPIVGDLSPWAVGAQFFGFAPAEYTRQLEENALLKGIDKAVAQDQTKLLQRMFVSNHVGDMGGYQDAYEKLSKLFAKHPALGDVNEVIKNSFAQQERISQDKYHGITISKKLKPELTSLASELQD